MTETISPDYLVIGAGAMGMAFIDTLVTDTQATVAVVDRYARPGGHWIVAYPFVRLHQPSEFYGVNSRPLGEGHVDQVGLNKGMVELATGDEVCAYYSKVMHQTLLPSGRVTYYPKHEWMGNGQFRSILTNKVVRVGHSTRIVDATYMRVKVPAQKPPSYEIAKDVSHITLNDLPKVSRPFGGYTVVGAGKTGIDACLWLVTNGIDPKDISWIMPRDAWLFERSGLQPGSQFFERIAARLAAVDEAILSASSLEDLYLRLEACGELMRVDDKVWPTSKQLQDIILNPENEQPLSVACGSKAYQAADNQTGFGHAVAWSCLRSNGISFLVLCSLTSLAAVWKCATVSPAELEQLKRVGTIIRQGRVVRLDADKVTLENGIYKPVPDTLYIDCTSDGIPKLDPVPVFSGSRITLQPVRRCQQVFSSAFIAHVEATYRDDKVKNELCGVVPHPNRPIDLPIGVFQSLQNELRWYTEPSTVAWLKQARLDWARGIVESAPEHLREAASFNAEKKVKVERICVKLKELVNTTPEQDTIKAKAQLARL